MQLERIREFGEVEVAHYNIRSCNMPRVLSAVRMSVKGRREGAGGRRVNSLELCRDVDAIAPAL